MIVAHIEDEPARIIAREAALLYPDPKTIGSLHFKLSVDRDTHSTRQKNVKLNKDQNFKFICGKSYCQTSTQSTTTSS